MDKVKRLFKLYYFLALVLVFKLNIINPLIMIFIGFLEGLATKIQMTSVIKIYML